MQTIPHTPRNRWLYTLLIGITIVLGLSSRLFAGHLPAIVVSHAGDTLWALMVFLLVGWLAPRLSTLYVALIALVFSFCIEFSQLYHTPWLNTLRENPLIALVIGRGFLWIDLGRYCVGISLGVLLEFMLRRK